MLRPNPLIHIIIMSIFKSLQSLIPILSGHATDSLIIFLSAIK